MNSVQPLAGAEYQDYDCDFLIDCDGDEGLREVLHMLCSTPRPGTLPLSPRSNNTPKKGLQVERSPLKSAVEESNLKYLSQFNEPPLNQLLDVLSTSSQLAVPDSVVINNLVNTAATPGALDSNDVFPVPTQRRPPPLIMVQESNEEGSNEEESGARWRANKRRQVIGDSESARKAGRPRGSLGARSRGHPTPALASSSSLASDTDMRLGSAPPRGQKEVALNNRNNRNSVTPLAYLLSQPFLANVSAPLSCPIENVPTVAVVVASPAEAAPLTSIESALVSDDEKFSRHEQSLVNGRLQRVGDKGKLFALSRGFICRCVALQADASLTNEAGEVLVSVDHMEQHLQANSRRLRDVANVFCAVRLLCVSPQKVRGFFVFRGLRSQLAYALFSLQEAAIRRYSARAVLTGLIADPASVGSSGGRPVQRITQEVLSVGLLELYLAGYDAISVFEAARLLTLTIGWVDYSEESLVKRLYDVANALWGAGLLRKESSLFHWGYPLSPVEIRAHGIDTSS